MSQVDIRKLVKYASWTEGEDRILKQRARERFREDEIAEEVKRLNTGVVKNGD
jgi:tRNA A-37 threonylcarbamoyl transferase component Bud32